MTTNTTAPASPTVEELDALVVATKAARDAHNTQATREAYMHAWNARSAAIVARDGKPKTQGFGSRAGKRQAAALKAECNRTLSRKRWA